MWVFYFKATQVWRQAYHKVSNFIYLDLLKRILCVLNRLLMGGRLHHGHAKPRHVAKCPLVLARSSSIDPRHSAEWDRSEPPEDSNPALRRREPGRSGWVGRITEPQREGRSGDGSVGMFANKKKLGVPGVWWFGLMIFWAKKHEMSGVGGLKRTFQREGNSSKLKRRPKAGQNVLKKSLKPCLPKKTWIMNK